MALNNKILNKWLNIPKFGRLGENETKYRIISIEAADIYRQKQENGVSVEYKMPESKSDAYFRLFKIYLDNSLDLVELKSHIREYAVKSFLFKIRVEMNMPLPLSKLNLIIRQARRR